MKKYLVLGLAALLLTTIVSPGTALAGGRGNGGGSDESRGGATLSVAPNPVSAWGAEYTVTGVGLKPNWSVYFVMRAPECCAFFTLATDGTGGVTFQLATGAPGTYEVEAYQRLHGGKLSLVASTTFSVLP